MSTVSFGIQNVNQKEKKARTQPKQGASGSFSNGVLTPIGESQGLNDVAEEIGSKCDIPMRILGTDEY